MNTRPECFCSPLYFLYALTFLFQGFLNFLVYVRLPATATTKAQALGTIAGTMGPGYTAFASGPATTAADDASSSEQLSLLERTRSSLSFRTRSFSMGGAFFLF